MSNTTLDTLNFEALRCPSWCIGEMHSFDAIVNSDTGLMSHNGPSIQDPHLGGAIFQDVTITTKGAAASVPRASIELMSMDTADPAQLRRWSAMLANLADQLEAAQAG